MNGGRLSDILQVLQRMARADGRAEDTDGQLLERYVARRDEAAFAVLVRRHGPLVWGVCRRLLSQAQDAEDCFQATFLILARRATSIGKRESVRSWLYGVAYCVAARARGAAARRRAQEVPLLESAAVAPAAAADPDLRPVLDEELARLPVRGRPEDDAPGGPRRLRRPLRPDLRRQRGRLPGGGLKEDVLSTPVAKTPIPKMGNISLDKLLRKILARVPSRSGATYLLRPDCIEITTEAAVRAELGRDGGRLLPLVSARFDRLPLAAALRELSDRAAFSILVDGRVAEKANTPVTAVLANVPLDTAVSLLADMAGLGSVVVDNVCYVTTPDNAARLRAREGQKERRRHPARAEARKDTGKAAGAGVPASQ